MSTQKQNIVLVTIDSLRADHCSFTGYERETTPTLDQLAEEGITFANAISPGPATPQSTPAMFTGNYPESGGPSIDGSASGRRERIRAHMQNHRTTAERLKEMGYRTAAFTPNPWTSRYFSFDQGFDHFEDFMGEDRSSSIWEKMLEGSGSTPLTALRLVASWIQRANTFKPWESFIDEVQSWIENGSEPYFVWVFLLDVHFPYLTGRGHRTQSRWRTYEANLRLYLENQDTPYSDRVHEQLVTAYDDSLRYTDDFLAEIVEQVDQANTSLVVTGDHGEAFGEHGTYGHHDELYRENIHVPLVVSGGPSADVESPISVRSLPQMLTRTATKDWEAVTNMGGKISGSRTEDSEVAAIWGDSWEYIQDGPSSEFYYVSKDESQLVEDAMLNAAGEKRLDKWRSELEYSSRLSEVAREVTSENGEKFGGSPE
jgi:arylsulfatase